MGNIRITYPEEPYTGEELDDDFETDLIRAQNDDDVPPTQKLRNLIILDAIAKKASDIYVEYIPDKNSTVRYKVGGELFEMMLPPTKLHEPILNEFKDLFGLVDKKEVYEGLNILEKSGIKKKPRYKRRREYTPTREFSDGDVTSFSTTIFTQGEDLNMNFSQMGSNYHIELFDSANFSLEMDPRIEELADKNRGLILLSSPPDNGKSTTAYQLLNKLKRADNVLTSIEKKICFPFEIPRYLVGQPEDYDQIIKATRSYSPDIILFDDITDKRMAKDALNFATEGRLVLAVVPAKDAVTSLDYFNRLCDGDELLIECLEGIVSQRLVRMVPEEVNRRKVYRQQAVYQLLNSNISRDDLRSFLSGENRDRIKSKFDSYYDLVERLAEQEIVEWEELKKFRV